MSKSSEECPASRGKNYPRCTSVQSYEVSRAFQLSLLVWAIYWGTQFLYIFISFKSALEPYRNPYYSLFNLFIHLPESSESLLKIIWHYWIFMNHLEPSWTFLNLLEPSWTFLNLSLTFLNLLEHSWALSRFPNLLEPSVVFSFILEPSWNYLSLLDLL